MMTRDPFEAALLAEQSAPAPESPPAGGGEGWRKRKKNEEENENENEEEENENENEDFVECGEKRNGDPDPDGLARIQEIISQFTKEQMNRYETFRRSGFKKTKMIKILGGILGTQKISDHMSITVSALAKMFVGDLIETARVIMMERKDKGPIRPCHIREAYRKLKIEGKIPTKSSAPQLFR